MHHRTTMGLSQRARTKARIIEAAIKVFAAKAPHVPVIRDFVEAAGIGRGTFYYYFSTVEEVRKSALDAVTYRQVAEIAPAIRQLSNPILRFATAVRMYQRRMLFEPKLAAFITSTTYIPSVFEERSQSDICLAIEQGLVKLRDVKVAYLVAVALSQFAISHPKERRPGHLGGKQLVRAILNAWGVESALIDEALRISLPRIDRRRLRLLP